MIKEKIAIIGAGNLGVSIAKGIVEKGLSVPENITLTRRNSQALAEFSEAGFNTSSQNIEAVKSAQIIILCVQPNQLNIVIKEIKAALNESHVLISVITGISIAHIQDQIGNDIPFIRAMPNTAIAIGESMTCISATGESRKSLPLTELLFATLGKTLVIEEELMQAATVLGASGIAFFMRYLRAATQGGIQMGFDAKDAQLIAVQTAKGAATLILEHDSHPEVEIDKVTTPQGCTIEGLNEMEHKGFSSALIQGIMTSFQRITKMKGTEIKTEQS
ncbi:MAG: pyrroline-5-carboxylate reductase [Cyclobacteriaceae bacterium]